MFIFQEVWNSAYQKLLANFQELILKKRLNLWKLSGFDFHIVDSVTRSHLILDFPLRSLPSFSY